MTTLDRLTLAATIVLGLPVLGVAIVAALSR